MRQSRFPLATLAVMLLLFVFSGLSAALSAQAGENRFSLVTKTPQFQRMEEAGVWDTTVLPEAIEFSCLTCGGAVVARLETISPYVSDLYDSLEQIYLADRRQFCADLVSGRDRRCISSSQIRWNFSLRGFHSEYETALENVIELVLFHRGYEGEFEMLKTTIRVEKGANPPANYSGMFLHYMSRLSPFY
ncbi:hypothetical protein [Pseudophaeobacter sp. EL27]|uniref:hypothetical protein n=1 Tax=Pseudophaeobacter sp. EL27 TaxID=2107580 RepID=UPI0013C42DA7|nr:hypothetical protein [Pseudophaeobacter sp. EL27]